MTQKCILSSNARHVLPDLALPLLLMNLQEVSTVLNIAILWDLPNKQHIAATAAAAAIAAAGLTPGATVQQQQQQQQQLQSDQSAAAAEQQQQQHDELQAQPHRTDRSSSSSSVRRKGPVARTAADAVLLLHRFCSMGYQPPGVLSQHLMTFTGPRLHELSLLQV
jgi:hypothetical protein